MRKTTLSRTLLAGLATAAVAIASGVASGIIPDPVIPMRGKAYGKTYGEWSAEWWKFFIETPCNGDCWSGVGSPYYDPTGDLVSLNQTSPVWFVAAPLGPPVERHYTVPRGTALFIAQTVAECSDVEEDPFFGATAEEQSVCAAWWGDHMQNVSFSVDGVPVPNMDLHRVQSPQFSFVLPENNILLGPDGGGTEGTAVSDGYWVLVTPLSVGEHTLHWTGEFVGTGCCDFPADVTDHVTVE